MIVRMDDVNFAQKIFSLRKEFDLYSKTLKGPFPSPD